MMCRLSIGQFSEKMVKLYNMAYLLSCYHMYICTFPFRLGCLISVYICDTIMTFDEFLLHSLVNIYAEYIYTIFFSLSS